MAVRYQKAIPKEPSLPMAQAPLRPRALQAGQTSASTSSGKGNVRKAYVAEVEPPSQDDNTEPLETIDEADEQQPEPDDDDAAADDSGPGSDAESVDLSELA